MDENVSVDYITSTHRGSIVQRSCEQVRWLHAIGINASLAAISIQILREFLEQTPCLIPRMFRRCQMYAELQMPTPLVPTREVYFLRYSKKVDHLWVVVDVSVDSLRGNPPLALLRCRKRPSGCLIEGTKNGYSKVCVVT